MLFKKKFAPLAPDARFSILVPTWNNLEMVKKCVAALRENSTFRHQIILHINDGSDGTTAWAEAEKDLFFTRTAENAGICFGLNAARTLAECPFLVYFNDDMIALPGWDAALFQEIEKIGHQKFMLSATMIEPTDTGNPCVLVKNFGRSLDDFDEKGLLADYEKMEKTDWQGSTWPPNLVPRDLWDLVGGLSPEFSPGFYSDPDFSMKCWAAGVRHFQGVGASRVYHFGSRSTRKIRKSNGKSLFLKKWGVSSSAFSRYFLRRGEPFDGPLVEPRMPFFVVLKDRLKRFL